jgi:peptide/nickel transport system permease protein
MLRANAEAKTSDGFRWHPLSEIRGLTISRPRAVGLALVSFFAFVAVFADFLAPYDPSAFGVPFLPPSGEHILGTNDMGQDILSEIIFGTRNSLMIGMLAATLSMFIGVMVGLAAGYFRGVVEDVIMGNTDIFILIPGLPLMIIISTYLDPSFWNVILVISLLWWCGTARVVHSKVVQIREMNYIASAKTVGFSHAYIMFKHVLVNIRDIVFAKYAMAISSAMLAEASLSFIGLGDPFNISWGTIINHAFSRGGYALGMWWWYLPPGILITLVAFSFILLSWPIKRNKVPTGMI